MTKITPPSFAGLQWSEIEGGHEHRAAATEAFWTLYRVAKPQLFYAGIKITSGADGDWIVVFTPKYSHQSVQRTIDLLLLESTDAIAAQAERDRIAAEERAAYAERRRIEMEERKAKAAAMLDEAVSAAKDCQQKWGQFCDRKDKLRELLEHHDDPDKEALTLHQVMLLKDIVTSTEGKSRDMLRRAAALENEGVDWPDDEVIVSINRLTGADSDQASKKNNVGWNKPDSPVGHWCAAMLNIDPIAAIKVARTILGKYAKSQLGRDAA